MYKKRRVSSGRPSRTDKYKEECRLWRLCYTSSTLFQYISRERNSHIHFQCIYLNCVYRTSQIIYCKLSCWRPNVIYFLSHGKLHFAHSVKTYFMHLQA